MTYARLLVEIPLNQEYPTCIMFENENGNIVEQRMEYEWKSVLCTKCKNFGHENSECRRKENGEAGKRRCNQTTKMGHWGVIRKKGEEVQRMEPTTNQGVKSTNDHTSTSMTGKQANILFGFLETKIKRAQATRAALNLCAGWSFSTNLAEHPGGRIWLLWKSNVYKVEIKK
ncbi:hypothetical protein R3W88_012169 [Solanum pinnatisectum]|uniref:Zinc knuckle CX2CX4HX4C domain-containing protein n=1 Tax=Solanum pinnatisectum TaxID=50273 RepID=A0AAV9L8L2_9SOLN|nr:hypothetical protein R3W88_012169 [Solanum pinnatisectum]